MLFPVHDICTIAAIKSGMRHFFMLSNVFGIAAFPQTVRISLTAVDQLWRRAARRIARAARYPCDLFRQRILCGEFTKY